MANGTGVRNLMRSRLGRMVGIVAVTLEVILGFTPSLLATEYEPWLGNFLEFEERIRFVYEHPSALARGSHFKKYHSNNLFLTASLSNALTQFGLELEATQARTRRQSGNIDQLKATGRYVWLDDVAGDPISFVTGLSLIQAFVPSLHDINSFHHGRREAELFVSLGKETADKDRWDARWWTVASIGSSEKGSPWLRFNAIYEKRWQEKHELKGFVHTLWGLGKHSLPLRHFKGYQRINHQSIDIGLRYTYLLEFFGSASMEYAYRVYARNFPAQTHHVLLQLFYTFGL